MKVQNFYENLSTLHVGTMDNRCCYVPKQDGRESQILLSGIYERSDAKVRLQEGMERFKGFIGDPFPTKVEITAILRRARQKGFPLH